LAGAVSNCVELHNFKDLIRSRSDRQTAGHVRRRPEEHNRRRVGTGGSATFAEIADNVSLALDKGVQIAARVNVDKGNVSTLLELAGEF
jgi:hypothetical protein